MHARKYRNSQNIFVNPKNVLKFNVIQEDMQQRVGDMMKISRSHVMAAALDEYLKARPELFEKWRNAEGARPSHGTWGD
ncbi:hypothetical protein [Parendozoicomonas haliclonae]|uniref:Uncharacterized protein n=1 Tax=Parendozoicomonas haliclonae TaxID=1960125 RepID=A0A1X7AKS0_9GAMM|nr:hypothetical protein [Parendozoicomonas haliclonae]SMA47374.1 hypothetical protein EHSB41UT_02390 [Parendozoicomonas haliclonae]